MPRWFVFVFFFKQKTAYDMRISDWSSDVCSSDLGSQAAVERARGIEGVTAHDYVPWDDLVAKFHGASFLVQPMLSDPWGQVYLEAMKSRAIVVSLNHRALSSEEHTSELQSLMRISYTGF